MNLNDLANLGQIIGALASRIRFGKTPMPAMSPQIAQIHADFLLPPQYFGTD
jgi:hypothetical protein